MLLAVTSTSAAPASAAPAFSFAAFARPVAMLLRTVAAAMVTLEWSSLAMDVRRPLAMVTLRRGIRFRLRQRRGRLDHGNVLLLVLGFFLIARRKRRHRRLGMRDDSAHAGAIELETAARHSELGRECDGEPVGVFDARHFAAFLIEGEDDDVFRRLYGEICAGLALPFLVEGAQQPECG